MNAYWVFAKSTGGAVIRTKHSTEAEARAHVELLEPPFYHATITTDEGRTLVAYIPL